MRYVVDGQKNMHELSLCRSIYRLANSAIDQEQRKNITVIELDIGALRQVVPQTLQYCWKLTTKRTQMHGSVLQINYRPAIIKCQECDRETQIGQELIFACQYCKSTAYSVISGEEFCLKSIELKEN